MKQIITKGIVLGRTDYGEADRIITMLTPDQGKLRVMARGVRRVKSKLAGGIELFSISDVTYMPGKGDLGTLISTRLNKYYANIVKDINRVQLGYELIKQLNKVTEDEPEEEYFHLLNESFQALDDDKIDLDLIRIWFQAQLLKFSGHTPNLQTDTEGRKLEADKKYNFDFENMSFIDHPQGKFTASHIKTLRLLFEGHAPAKLQQVNGLQQSLKSTQPLLQLMNNAIN